MLTQSIPSPIPAPATELLVIFEISTLHTNTYPLLFYSNLILSKLFLPHCKLIQLKTSSLPYLIILPAACIHSVFSAVNRNSSNADYQPRRRVWEWADAVRGWFVRNVCIRWLMMLYSNMFTAGMAGWDNKGIIICSEFCNCKLAEEIHFCSWKLMRIPSAVWEGEIIFWWKHTTLNNPFVICKDDTLKVAEAEDWGLGVVNF